MADGKSYRQWTHTCEIVAMTANVQLPKHKQIDPRRIHPHGRVLSTSRTPIKDTALALAARYKAQRQG
jgi:hypothetical protein